MLVRRLAALLALTPAVARALWPLPRSIQSGTSVLKLSPSFDIHISTLSGKAPQDLQDAITRTKFFLQNDKLGRLIVGRGSSDADALSSAPKLVALTLELTSESREEVEVASIAIEARKPLEDRDEAYTLNVPADGSPATLAANTTLGLLRGLTTFGQMWYHYGGETYAVEMPVSIVDSPAYPYRGLLLDTARNFFPVGDIKRTLDAMSMVKISTFFWHVVDSQSFPLQIPGFMNVSGLGAYDDASVYTPEDVQDIVSYAGERGIDVLLELDTPGHTTIISKSYPEHVACPELSPWATYANEPPAGQLRFVQPETAEFTANLLAAAATMFPSQYISTGGDEVNIPCYEQDDRTVAILNQTGETLFEAMSSFIAVTHRKLEEMGKTPVVKEEMVLEYNVTTLSNETLVLVWISSEDASAVAQKGYRFIHYASNYFYLDCGGGEWLGADPDGNSWCDPFKTWQKSYSFDPVANLTEAEKLLVMGGQQPLWTEQSGPQNLDPIVWPRAASSAELYWSGPGGNVSTALPRLHDVAYRMRTRGIQAISLQPEWCALRPGACDLTA